MIMSSYLLNICLLLCCTLTMSVRSNDQSRKVANDKVIVCYMSSWAAYRLGRGTFKIDNIEPNLCTHLIYSFAGINVTTNSIRSLDPWQDLPDNYGLNGYGRLVQIKKNNPRIKVLLAIGGWNEGSRNYSIVAANPQRRTNFVDSALQFIKKYEFDGLDLDWEFPTERGGQPEDKQNFVSLIRELYSTFKKYNLLLTAAISANPNIINNAYDVQLLGKYLDLIHVMCYDYHGTWDLKTGANAPLRSDDNMDVEYSIKHLLKLGAPSEKLVMGVPFYGRTFILLDSDVSKRKQFGAPATNEGFKGTFTNQNGFMGYNEICFELQTNSEDWEILWDDLSQTPYAVSGNKVINYDNPKSITEKVKLAQKYHLGGIMVWSMDTDDFHGDCSNTNVLTKAKGYPLLRTINIVLAQAVDEPEDTNEIPIDINKKEPNSVDKNKFNTTILVLLVFIIFTSYNS